MADAIAYANERDRPLAAYIFSNEDDEIDAASTKLISGGLGVNEVLVHFAQHDLPFGGIGASGTGRIHGREGFDELSNVRGVFTQRSLVGRTGLEVLYPPYGALADRLVRLMGG